MSALSKSNLEDILQHHLENEEGMRHAYDEFRRMAFENFDQHQALLEAQNKVLADQTAKLDTLVTASQKKQRLSGKTVVLVCVGVLGSYAVSAAVAFFIARIVRT